MVILEIVLTFSHLQKSRGKERKKDDETANDVEAENHGNTKKNKSPRKKRSKSHHKDEQGNCNKHIILFNCMLTILLRSTGIQSQSMLCVLY